MRLFFCLLLLVPPLLAQLQCPGGTSFFDFESCDPTRRSQCPAGFSCRRGSSLTDPKAVVNLCCDSAVMSITDWFNEAGLTPTVVPQTPLSLIPMMRLGDLAPGTTSPIIHIADEIVTLTFPDFTTAMVNNLQLADSLQGGGFVHGLTIVDPLAKPWAVFASLNIPWPGGQFVDLTSARKGNGGFFFSHIANLTVPLKNSYRSQYVVLLYQTMMAIPTTIQSNITSCDESSCIFTVLSPLQVGAPVAGSLFYLTTTRPIFAIGETNFSPSVQFLPAIMAFIIAKYLF